MKKAFLSLLTAALLLCSACGGSKVTVAGTWYSVTDAAMYNFADGEITVSGVTVGQYEDNGDSVVVSFMDTGENVQLYVTNMGDIDVLADVGEGEGTTYFCKGLENAKAIIKEAQIAKEKAEEAAHEAAMDDRAAFAAYLKENLYGVWVSDNPNKNVVQMEFSDGVVVETDKWGNVTTEYILDDPAVVLNDGVPEAELLVSENEDGSNAGYIFITLTDETYTDNRVQIFSWTFTKQ